MANDKEDYLEFVFMDYEVEEYEDLKPLSFDETLKHEYFSKRSNKDCSIKNIDINVI